MQQLSLTKLILRPLLILALTPIGAPVWAQDTPDKNDKANDSTIILIAEHRSSGAASKKDELNSMMKETLNSLFTDSGLYTVFTFSPYLPVLKQATLNHSLDVADLEEPLKPAALHKIASLLGARRILTFHAVLDKTGVKSDIAYEEIAAQNTWRTAFTNQFRTPLAVSKRKLKLEEMVDVNVDSIAKGIGVPSHLLDDLHLEVALQPVPAGPNKGRKPGKSADKPATDKPDTDKSVANNSTEADTGTASAQTGATNTTIVADNPPQGTDNPPQGTNNPPVKSRAATKSTSNTSKRRGPIDPGVLPITPLPTVSTNNVGDGAQATPTELSQPGVEENITNAARAERYRASGDLPSTILFLRRAVDDNPTDVAIRRQLIQAYQDDNMPDLAEAEINRSLKMDPRNAVLFRLHGDALYTNGRLGDALKAYQQAIELDPKDVLAKIALGDIQAASGEFDAAVKAYQEAAVAAPTSPVPHRRLARAACQRASSDSSQYTLAIAEVKKARSLTAPTETESYLTDYVTLMRIMESRMVDILDQLDNTYTAYLKGQSGIEANRIVKDMIERATAASDFLDALPAASGQEVCQALYMEGTASILSSLSYLKSFVEHGETQYELKLKIEKTSARHDLTDAGKRLKAAKAVTESR